jgi:integrase
MFPGRRPRTRLSKTAGWRTIKRAFAAAGIVGAPTEIGTHTLRKTFARLIYSALDYELVRIIRAMRHANVSTTVEYFSFDEAEVNTAILAL